MCCACVENKRANKSTQSMCLKEVGCLDSDSSPFLDTENSMLGIPTCVSDTCYQHHKHSSQILQTE